MVSQPLRRGLLSVLRFPLVIVETVFSGLAWLPQLPTLAQENAALRSELATRQLEVIRLREAVRHLTRAPQLLSAVQHPSGTIASIIGRSFIPTEHLIFLNKGSRDGIVLDGVIVAAEGLVGRVLEVHPTTSTVLLVTDPNSRIACLVERSRETGLLVGTGQRLNQFIYLDLEADVTVDDRVVTAGLGGPFPKGLLIGTVVRVVQHEESGSMTAWVKPAVSLSQLEEVVCLPPASSS